MSQLLGIAFSSPSIVPLLIDNTRFMVHMYTGQKQTYVDFLTIQEPRKKVILVASLRKLLKAKELDTNNSVSIYMLFDRPDILSRIQDCTILDAEEDPFYPGSWIVKTEKITQEKLNTILEDFSIKTTDFTIDPDIIYKASLLEPSVFDFINQVISSIPKVLPSLEDSQEEDTIGNREEFVEQFTRDTIAWICGINHARLWILRYKKRLNQIGADSDLILDLYRFCAEGKASKNIFQAYHAARKGMSLNEAARKFEAHPEDLEKCVTMYPVEEEREYKAIPSELPINLS